MAKEINKKAIIDFINGKSGKVTNLELTEHFKGQLNQSNFSNFKAIVKKVTSVHKEKNGVKYIVVKDKYTGNGKENDHSSDTDSHKKGSLRILRAESLVRSTGDIPRVVIDKVETGETSTDGLEVSHTSSGRLSKSNETINNPKTSNDVKELGLGGSLETITKPIDLPVSPTQGNGEPSSGEKSENKKDPASPSVKDRARNLNTQEPHKVKENLKEKVKEKVLRETHAHNNNSHDSDKGSNCEHDFHLAFHLTPEQRKWMLASAECQYSEMAKMLTEYPDLVNWKNFINGYTALHYSCKFGDAACVKLLCGNYKAKVDIINNAGHTPLHLAAMHSQEEIIRLLVSNYRAKTNLRDYSGRMPKDHVPISSRAQLQRYFGQSKSMTTLDTQKLVNMLGGAEAQENWSSVSMGQTNGANSAIHSVTLPTTAMRRSRVGSHLGGASFLAPRTSTHLTRQGKGSVSGLDSNDFEVAVRESFRRKREALSSVISPGLAEVAQRPASSFEHAEVDMSNVPMGIIMRKEKSVSREIIDEEISESETPRPTSIMSPNRSLSAAFSEESEHAHTEEHGDKENVS